MSPNSQYGRLNAMLQATNKYKYKKYKIQTRIKSVRPFCNNIHTLQAWRQPHKPPPPLPSLSHAEQPQFAFVTHGCHIHCNLTQCHPGLDLDIGHKYCDSTPCRFWWGKI